MSPQSPPSLIAREAGGSARRLVVVSNRLPVRLQIADGKWSWQASSGGLATAVSGIESDVDSVWVGWPGCPTPDAIQPQIEEDLRRDGLAPVFLSAREEAGYYNVYCNRILWPLFHYFTDMVSHESAAWEAYRDVNRRFADKVLEQCGPGDRVWIHDFHLLLVPAMLRTARPDLEVGFFLHVPWPSSEIFRLLPHREALLRGILGADYIAFHTNEYAHHFRRACLRVLGLDSDPQGVSFEHRRIGIGRHPIGIDTAHFNAVAGSDESRAIRDDLRRRYEGRRVILGIERLDYTKGVPHKLRAFERFLEQDPKRAETTTLLQIIVPSRLSTPEYQELKLEIEGLVGRINGKYGGPGYTPVEYMHRELTPARLVALYQFADIGLVTPVRDGMNLVAQEFVLCQHDGSGMLMLSEFAGAAQVLGESVLVNPWNIERTAQAIADSFEIPPDERERRMRPMIDRVERLDCKVWANEFLRELSMAAAQSRSLRNCREMSGAAITELSTRFAAAGRRVVFLDYDGTLCELAARPDMAQPTEEILEVVRALTGVPRIDIHIVSGRKRDDLERWFGSLPVHLCCEHGSVLRRPGGEWESMHSRDLGWMVKVREMLEDVCREVPRSAIEDKEFSIAWHYRLADLDYGLWRSRELLHTLEQEVSNLGLEVISGNKVIEVRLADANKGNYARRVLQHEPPDAFVLAIGDDRTDIDMYRALPGGAVSIHVGSVADEAGFTIQSPEHVRQLLGELAASGECTVAAR